MKGTIKSVLAGELGWIVRFEEGGGVVVPDEPVPDVGDVVAVDDEDVAYDDMRDRYPRALKAKIWRGRRGR